MKPICLLCFSVLSSLASFLNAQSFQSYVALGGNIASDKYTTSGKSQVGSRIGLNVGPGVMVQLNERLDLGMELLYSQNGIYINPDQFPSIELDRIRLHYLEVPIQLVFDLNARNTLPGGEKKMQVLGGVAISRLFHYNITPVDEKELSEPIAISKPNALLFHLGTAYSFSENYAVNGKVSMSTHGEFTFAIRLFRYF